MFAHTGGKTIPRGTKKALFRLRATPTLRESWARRSNLTTPTGKPKNSSMKAGRPTPSTSTRVISSPCTGACPIHGMNGAKPPEDFCQSSPPPVSLFAFTMRPGAHCWGRSIRSWTGPPLILSSKSSSSTMPQICVSHFAFVMIFVRHDRSNFQDVTPKFFQLFSPFERAVGDVHGSIFNGENSSWAWTRRPDSSSSEWSATRHGRRPDLLRLPLWMH